MDCNRVLPTNCKSLGVSVYENLHCQSGSWSYCDEEAEGWESMLVEKVAKNTLMFRP